MTGGGVRQAASSGPRGPVLAARPSRLRRLLPDANGLSSSSAVAFLVLVAGAGISYLAQVVTARFLGVESFGNYMYALAWMVVAATLSTMGLHVSALRLVAAQREAGEWSAMKGVIRFAARRVVVAGLVIALIGIAVTLGSSMGRDLRITLLVALAVAPLMAMQLVGAAVVRALGGVVSALAPERLGRDLVAVCVLTLLVGLNLAPPTAPTAMWAMAASVLVGLGLVLLLAQRFSPEGLRAATPLSAQSEWRRPALPLTFIMGADLVMARSGVVVLGLMGDVRGAGIFAVAFSLSALTALPRMAVASAFAPTVAALSARHDQPGLQALCARASRLTLLGAACVALPLLIALPALLRSFGPGFAEGTSAAAVLVVGQLVTAAAGPQQHLLTMTGRERAGATMHVGGALIGLALCFVLTDAYGVLGTAVAITTGLVLWNLAMTVYVFVRLGLRPGLLSAQV